MMIEAKHTGRLNSTQFNQMRLLEVLAYALVALFYYWMAAQIPYAHDDWDWGLDVGIEQLLTASINSRYVGNFFAVVMTRSEFLKIAIMGTGYWLLPLLMSRLVLSSDDEHKPVDRIICFALCNICLMTINTSVLSQTYNWVAGFANYCISAIFIVWVIQMMLRIFREDVGNKQELIWKCLIAAMICLAGQLFLEHLAIVVTLATLCVNIIYVKKHHRVSMLYAFMFFGSLIGLFIMFSSNVYGVLWKNGEMDLANRDLFLNANTNLLELVLKCSSQFLVMVEVLVEKSLWLFAIIQVFLIILLQKKYALTKKHLSELVIGSVMVFVLFTQYESMKLLVEWYAVLVRIMMVAFIVAIAFELVLVFKTNIRKLGLMLCLLGLPVLIILPLCFTTETGPRIFFTPIMILIMLLVALMHECLTQKMFGKKPVAAVLIIAALVCVFAYKGGIYHDIGMTKQQRDDILDNLHQSQDATVYLPLFPHGDHLWCPDPTNDWRYDYFYEFYNVPESVSIVFGDGSPGYQHNN